MPHAESSRWQTVANAARPVLALAVIGLVAFDLSLRIFPSADGIWFPAVGIGIALTAWLGPGIVPFLVLDAFLARYRLFSANEVTLRLFTDSILLGAQVGFSWWAYQRIAEGSRRMEDPRSATLFLIIVSGVLAAFFAAVQASASAAFFGSDEALLTSAGTLWISRALGILALTPTLLVTLSPWLAELQAIAPERNKIRPGGSSPDDWTWGDAIELAGLCIGTSLLALVLVWLHVRQNLPGWTLWGASLLLVVWSSLRQGLRGGSLAATASALSAFLMARLLDAGTAEFSPLQGNFLAQASTALLVGASAGWIRASEARYRQVVGHIPVVLYSVRLPRGFLPAGSVTKTGKAGSVGGSHIVKRAEVTLVSSAARTIFKCDPETLMGPYADWLNRVVVEDRELVIAAISQIQLNKQAVTCEYRIDDAKEKGAEFRWVRDTFAPQYDSAGSLEGWEGVIEDITEHRALSQNLRRTTNMLQALVTNLPMGVFFVQGPIGQPLLVNARARQLLGQREEMAAGIEHLSSVYRLHRPDGSVYPVEELPVVKALRTGQTSMANDVVVHRLDGRRMPLVTWAAPIDLTGRSTPDAAVWVMEDMTNLHQAESARREIEARLRAVFDAMAEGVVVQSQQGAILEANAAACAILGENLQTLLGRPSLFPEEGCLAEDGAPLSAQQTPERLALNSGTPVRQSVIGVPKGSQTHWLLVSSMPLLVGNVLGPNAKGARVVTTFADITEQKQMGQNFLQGQRLELVGRLASGIVHDLNNLLSVMIGLADVVRTAPPGDDSSKAELLRLIEVGELASHLTGQLLTFSKQRKITATRVDLNTLVRHSLKMIKGSIPPGIQVDLVMTNEDLLVEADETQLKQVVINLCMNSRDAMGSKGQLTITTDRGTAAGEKREESPWIRLSVTDTGHGMTREVQARLFEPFFTTKERGTGLGLAVVRQIIDDLDGQIQVTSTVDKGTAIEILLRSAPA